MFEWKPEYSVGVAQIDAQHKQLFEMAADLHKAMLSGQAKSALASLLARLVSYTRSHFATEEGLMQSSHYSGYAHQKAEHDALTQKVMAFQKDFEAGRVAVSVEILQFLGGWLREHIGVTDRKFGAYLNSQDSVTSRK